MITGDALRQVGIALRSQRIRTLLTMFGVFWGTASVVFLLSWGRGLERMLESGFTRVGPDIGIAWPGRIGEQYTPAAHRRELWFTRGDIDALSRLCHWAGPIGGEALAWSVVSYGERAYNEDVRGVERVNFELRSMRVAAGRPISATDVEHRRRVVVLGEAVRARLFGSADAVGSSVRIDGLRYDVVGVLARVGTQLWRDRSAIDDQVWIPLTTLLANRPRNDVDEEVVDTLLFHFPGPEHFADAKAEVRRILAERLRISPTDDEAIYVVSPAQALSQIPMGDIGGVFFLLAATTLVIGGVGIVNMMLDAVHERRSEIGVRLAVGARRRDVVGQFFFETLAMASVGGLAGGAFGAAGSWLLGRFQTADLIPVPILRADVVLLALGVMTAVGLIAALLPAWSASRVDPAQILRSE